MKRTPLRKTGKSTNAQTKKRIQALLRELAIKTDGGCFLRNYEEAGKCGGYRKDGQLILQAEHLISRQRSVSFAEPRNIVCLCQRHHFYFKKNQGRLYWELVERYVGEERWEWIKKVEADHKPYHFSSQDWLNAEIYLTQLINHE